MSDDMPPFNWFMIACLVIVTPAVLAVWLAIAIEFLTAATSRTLKDAG